MRIIILIMQELRAHIIGIARHRIMIDGDGVTTLVAFHGCPLRCRYCINPQSFDNGSMFDEYTPESLYEKVKIDELYFLATGGGVTFGGGEPCLYPEFIMRFREICGLEWKLNLETSLNVPIANVGALLPIVNTFIIDVKDLNPRIYHDYTLHDNSSLINNLRIIAENKRQDDCLIRLPLISGYNTEQNRSESRKLLEDMGFSRFDFFIYQIRKHSSHDKRKTHL